MPDVPQTALGVGLITRLRTPNKGNEALSSECIRALECDPRVERVVLVPRVPPYMLKFDTAAARAARSFMEAVDRWTAQALRMEAAAPGPAEALPHNVVLDERDKRRGHPVDRFKKMIGLRSRVAKLGRHDDDYGRRLRLVRECGNLVLNAAGEFWERADDIPFRHLLDLHFAKAVGCRTAIINHTFSLVDPAVLDLAAIVYNELDYISVRDETSRDAVAALGVDPARISIASDLVFLTEPEPAEQSGNVVALCPNTALRRSLHEDWGALIGALQARNIDCRLCSNDFPVDGKFLDQLSNRYGLPIVGRGLGYRAYSGLLGTFGAVVSGRLHTGVLAIVAGTPLIPVEGLTFKITAAMAEIGNPFPAVNFDDPRWLDLTVSSIEKALDPGGRMREATADVAARQKALAGASVAELVTAIAR